MKNTVRVGILGATGFVGQRFVQLLEHHPWFKVTAVAASPRSAGKKYTDAVQERWHYSSSLPAAVGELILMDVHEIESMAKHVDFVFSALNMEKQEIKILEESYAAHDIPVVSNNSAHRWTADVPMMIPEVNPHHVALIDVQRKNRSWKKGLIAVKPNCSIQSYVAILTALKQYQPSEVSVTSMQAISGAGRSFESWPEMVDNLIPFIGGEEEKSEKEPLKIWSGLYSGLLVAPKSPIISATCIRVAASDGHMASVGVKFQQKPTREQILNAIQNYQNPIVSLNLPSAPKQFITYFSDDTHPQTRLDRDNQNGMGITFGRLREDTLFDWKFVALSHNTIRGAAGGAILTAELLKSKHYL